MGIQNKNRFYSLQSRFLASALFIVLFPLLLATVTAFFLHKAQIEESLNRELSATICASDLFYQHELKRLNLVTFVTANDNTCKTTLRIGVIAQLQKHLAMLAGKYKIDFLLATDVSGRVMAFYPEYAFKDKFDLSSHSLVKEALNGNGNAVTIREGNPNLLKACGQVGNNSGAYLFLESALPIKIRDTVIGSVLAGIKLSGNDKMMQEMQGASGSDRSAVVSENAIVAASFKPCHLSEKGVCPIIGLNKDHAEASDKLSFVKCNFDMKTWVFKRLPIKGLNDKPVAAMVSILDYSRAASLTATAMMRVTLIFVAGMVIAVLIAYLLAKSIAGPVKKLSNAMHDLETGVFDEIALPTDRRDEIGTLIRGFNRMAIRLSSYVGDLKNEIAERVKAEKSLEAEKELLDVTLRSIGDAVITTDSENRIVLLNNVGEELTGWKHEEAAGKPWETVLKIIHEKTGELCEAPFRRVVENGEHVGIPRESALLSRDGTIRSIADSAAPIRDKGGNVIGVVIVFRDVTNEKRTEEELLKARKLESIGVLAGGLAHDFNNILAAIMGNVELASYRVGKQDEKTVSLLLNAKKAISRAVGLTKQLLTFAKGGDPIKEKTSLPELIKDSADFILHGSNVICEYSFPEDFFMVDADSGQVSQVVQNIIMNAKQAMPEGGKIAITCSNIYDPSSESLLNVESVENDKFVKITIEDTGKGIPEAVLQNIFDPYFSTKKEGSGLGLAICHSIITKHGGVLSAFSKPGHGAVFTFYLQAITPLCNADNQSRQSVEALLSSVRIMVVDDEKMIRDMMKTYLESLGHEVILVNEGGEAIDKYRKLYDSGKRVDLVIVDLTIPGGLGGVETSRRLLGEYPDAKLIVASGYSNDPVMSDYSKYGFKASITKPFDLSKLHRAVKIALES